MASRRQFITGVVTASTVAIAGCSGSEPDSEGEESEPDSEGQEFGEEEEEVRDVIETHFEAIESEERNLLISTLHPNSPAYESTIESNEQLWRQYNLQYNYEISSVEIDGDIAEVEIIQETTGSSEDFRDNRLTAVWKFRTYQGEWRLYSSTTQNVEYLN